MKKIKFVNGQMYEYEEYSLIDSYAPILKTKTQPFDFTNPQIDPKYLAISLIETMVKHKGVGISANQVGLPYRVFVMGAEKVGFACFNPEILESSGSENFEEGCLSFPGLFVPIKRPSKIKVRYTDFNNITKEETFTGFTARIFQHELDHLDGICHLNRASPIHLARAKRKIKTNLKKIEEHKKQLQFQKNNSSTPKIEFVNKQPEIKIISP